MKMMKKFWNMTSVIVSIVLLTSLLIAGTPAKALTTPVVTLGNPQTGQASAYTIQFNIDHELQSGDSITITFPPDTVITSSPTVGIEATYGWVGGAYVPSVVAAATYASDTAARTLTVTLNVGDRIGEGAGVRLEIANGITNPSIEDDYILIVQTSQETTPVASAVYSIPAGDPGDPTQTTVSQPIVLFGSYELGQETGCSIRFTVNKQLAQGDEIVIVFPSDTVLDPLGPEVVASDGWFDASYVQSVTDGIIHAFDALNRTITFTLASGDRIGEGSEVRVGIMDGITNPTTQGEYTLTVQTTEEPTPVASESYSLPSQGLSPATVSQPVVTLTNPVISEESPYVINFDLNIELAGGDVIIVAFPAGTILNNPVAYIQAGDGWVAGAYQEANLASVNTSFDVIARTLVFTLGYADCIGQGAQVRIEVASGITNPPDPGDCTLTVQAAWGTTPVESAIYTLVVPDVTPLPGIVTLYSSSGHLIDNWNGATAIQDALNAVAVAGSTVNIGAGTYTEDPVIVTPGTVITTGADAEDVIVIGTWTTAFTGSSVPTIIDGLTVRPATAGTSVMNITGDNVTVENCIVTKTEVLPDSQADEILITSSGNDGIIRGCSFDTTDGTVADKAVYISDGSVLVEECTFNINESSGDSYDFGIYIHDSLIQVSECVFIGSEGTGIYFHDARGTIENNVFNNLHLGVALGSTPQTSRVIGNRFNENDYGMLVAGNVDIIANNIYAGNDCAISIEMFCGYNIIENNTIVDSTSVGIRNMGVTENYINNCILWNNNDDLESCSATYSDISDGDTGEGNISQDPLFVDSANGDYHLQAGSPCIDAGGFVQPIIIDRDIDEESRVMDGDGNGSAIIDMGADEYSGGTQVIPVLMAPNDIDYHGVLLGDYLDLTTTISNDADAAFVVTGASRVAGSSEFTYAGPSTPFTVNPGQSVTMTIRYTPVSEDSASATFALSTDVPGNEVLTFDAFGYGVIMLYNPGGGIPGDVDGNGVVNVLDITMIARIILGLD